jgi:hypothetical protein
MKSVKSLQVLTATMAAVFVALSSSAQTTIYDNSLNDQGSNLLLTNNQVVGQEILPALGTTPYLYSFSYEFYGTNTSTPSFAGAVQGNVQFYKNDGSVGSPLTKFYDSGWYNLAVPTAPGNVGGFYFTWDDLYNPANGAAMIMDAQVGLPSNFTVAFSFRNLGVGDFVGLANFNPPTTGTNYADYWVNNGSWSLVNIGNTAVGMQLAGTTTPAPEPSVIALGAMGGLLMAHLIRRRKA